MVNNDQELDLERTNQAAERTFLAYVRTALTFFAVGATLIKFFDSFIFALIGWVFIPSALITFLFGLHRYQKIINHFVRVKKTTIFNLRSFPKLMKF